MIKRFRLLPLFILFLFTFAACRPPLAPAQKEQLTSKARGSYSIGDSIRNFSLLNVNGKRVSLKDYKTQKGLIIVFMRNTCEYCQAYESRIIALNTRFEPLGYPLIAISPFGDDPAHYPEDDLRHMKLVSEQHGFKFPYLSDEKLRITNLFNDQYTPVTYILQQKNGHMFLIWAGDIDNDWENRDAKKKKYVEIKLDSLLHPH